MDRTPDIGNIGEAGDKARWKTWWVEHQKEFKVERSYAEAFPER